MLLVKCYINILTLFSRYRIFDVLIVSGGSNCILLPDARRLLLEEEVILLPVEDITQSRERSI